MPMIAARVSVLVIAAILGAAVQAAPVQTCTGPLPDPAGGPREASCEYLHVPFATFSLSETALVATWGAEIRVLEAWIAADWQALGPYAAGTEARLVIDPSRSRYDIVGRASLNGQEFLFLTPVWHSACPAGLPPALAGCVGADPRPSDCSLTETKQCKDGTSVSVTCKGDSGSCSGCSTAAKACCKASVTKVTNVGAQTITEITSTQEESACTSKQEPGKSGSLY